MKKFKLVVTQIREMKLKESAEKVEDGIAETLTYYGFPFEHWTRIRTNNMVERLNWEIRHRIRVMGIFTGRQLSPHVSLRSHGPVPSGETKSMSFVNVSVSDGLRFKTYSS